MGSREHRAGERTRESDGEGREKRENQIKELREELQAVRKSRRVLEEKRGVMSKDTQQHGNCYTPMANKHALAHLWAQKQTLREKHHTHTHLFPEPKTPCTSEIGCKQSPWIHGQQDSSTAR